MGLHSLYKQMSAPDTGLGLAVAGVPFVLAFGLAAALGHWVADRIEQNQQKPVETIQADQPTDAPSLPQGTALTLNGGP